MSIIEQFDLLFQTIKGGSPLKFHELEEAYHTKRDLRAAPFLALLYHQGASSTIVPNEKKGKSLLPDAWTVLQEAERRLSDDETQALDTDGKIFLFILGLFYKEGFGVAKDTSKAMKFFHRSAECDYPPAVNMIGNSFYNNFCGELNDYSKSFILYQRAANELHYPAAHFNVAMHYHYGKGVPVDNEKAYEHYAKAAECGNCPAARQMWLYYLKKNENAKAIQYLRMEINEGEEEATVTLAELLEKGTGCEKNVQEAIALLQRAAEQPETASLLDPTVLRKVNYVFKRKACFKLAQYYEQGKVVERDDTKAYGLFLKTIEFSKKANSPSSSAIVHEAQYKVGLALISGDGVAEDAALGVKYIEDAAGGGNPSALFALGMFYHAGDLKPQSAENARKYFVLAANARHPEGSYMAGMYLLDTVAGETKAMQYFQLAVLGTECTKANYMLGFLHHNGRGGIRQSFSEALKFYLTAADAGDVDAMYNIGMMYLYGDGVDQSDDKAKEWLEKAAELGDADSMYNLATLLMKRAEGEFSDEEEEVTVIDGEDYDKALSWLKQAAEKGDSDAKEKLKLLSQ